MKQALTLYTRIKRKQMFLAFILGILLMLLQLGSSFWQDKLPESIYSGVALTAGWLLLGFVSLLNDQSRRLDTWLYTQRISRGQLFLTRVLLLVVVPIIIGLMVNVAVVLCVHPMDLWKPLENIIEVCVGFYFFAAISALIYTVIGPSWMKVAGTIFTLFMAIKPMTYIESKLNNIWWLDFTSTFMLATILFAFSYSLSKKISADTVDEAVRLKAFRWPVVLFVFLSSYLMILSNNFSTLNIKVVIGSLIIPLIASGITFTFIFKPTFKITWDR